MEIGCHEMASLPGSIVPTCIYTQKYATLSNNLSFRSIILTHDDDVEEVEGEVGRGSGGAGVGEDGEGVGDGRGGGREVGLEGGEERKSVMCDGDSCKKKRKVVPGADSLRISHTPCPEEQLRLKNYPDKSNPHPHFHQLPSLLLVDDSLSNWDRYQRKMRRGMKKMLYPDIKDKMIDNFRLTENQ